LNENVFGTTFLVVGGARCSLTIDRNV